MGCSRCGSTPVRGVVHHMVRRPDGSMKRWSTRAEAEADAAATGGKYVPVTR